MTDKQIKEYKPLGFFYIMEALALLLCAICILCGD